QTTEAKVYPQLFAPRIYSAAKDINQYSCMSLQSLHSI
ncbi:MAG: hypothetical protein ACI9JP_003315, partial [Granulosicoccus sp.]